MTFLKHNLLEINVTHLFVLWLQLKQVEDSKQFFDIQRLGTC